MIYFHGNAATRAASNRVRTARHLTDLGANFLIIDYRGFADSTRAPPPSEEGLLVDARRAWDYVHSEKGVPALIQWTRLLPPGGPVGERR